MAEQGEYKVNDRCKLWESVELVPQVDRFRNYVNSEIGIETAITKELSQTTFIQDTYRTEPAAGRLKNDVKLVAGITYKFQPWSLCAAATFAADASSDRNLTWN